MKFFQFQQDGYTKLGYCIGNQLVNAAETIQKNHSDLPSTLHDLLHTPNYKALLPRYAQLDPVFLDNAPCFAPAVTHPEKIICIGLNYRSHIEETALVPKKDFPPVFPKYPNSLVGHNHPIHLPKQAEQFDYEAELVIVIGKRTHDVTPEQAKDHIFGYSIGNDFSARDLQFATGQWLLGKACDDFAPVGPFLVTADSIDPDHLDISCRVNGELRQQSNTKHMIFSSAEIVSYLSHYITLQPGDLIYSGTPSGVILGMEEKNWLKSGDRMEVTIEHIGTLTNWLK